MKNMFKKYGFAAMALALVLTVSVTQVQAAEISSVDFSVSPTDGLSLSFKLDKALDLAPASVANVKIEYFTKNGDVKTPIQNAAASNAALIKDKTWGGYLWNSAENKYPKGTDLSGTADIIPANTLLTTLVRNGYSTPIDWTAPATYVVDLTVTDNDGIITSISETEVVIDPTAKSVSTESELFEAITNNAYTKINLTQNIEVTNRIIVARPLTISGVDGSKTITFTGAEKNWVSGSSNYVLQAYNTTVTLNDVKLTDGYAGLLVNGSTVNAKNLDVSGNNVGGVDVSNGGTLNISGELKNSTEAYAKPTIWVDGNGTVNGFTGTQSSTVKNNQVQYYLTANNAKKTESVSTTSALKSALLDVNVGTVVITAPIETAETITINRSVVIDGGNNTIKALGGISGSIILVTGNNVTLKNLTVDGSGNYVQGIQAYKVTGVVITNVTSKNNGKSGIHVNGSTVTATNVATTGNAWHGINVDQGGGVTTSAVLTLLGSNSHGETLPVWVDNKAKDVSVTATSYTATDVVYTKNDLEITGKKYALTPSITEGNSTLVINTSTPEVNITVDEDVVNPKLDFTALVNGGTEATTPVAITVATETEDGLVTVSIPTGTKITGTGAWTELALPKVSSATITPTLTSRQAVKIGHVIEIGSPSMNFTFDKPVRLVFAGEAGQKVGFMKVGGTFTEITTECGLGEVLPAGVQECKVDTTSDLVVLTKHFTTFATYEVETRRSSGGGSSGGRVAVVTTPVAPTVTTPTVVPTGQVLGETTFNFTVAMKVGSSNKASVMELQKFLNAGNFGVLAVDGAFGPKTKAAVMAFQRANLLVADGIVGPKTLAALNK